VSAVLVPRILGLGDNSVDTYVDQGMQYPGGNAVNVAVLARRLGMAAGYLGCLGTDAAGDLLFQALQSEGVEVGRCRRINGPNARAMIGHRDGDRHFLASSRGARGQYDLRDADFAYIAGFDLVHTSIFSELDDDLARIRCVARRISYDFSERWSELAFARVLPYVDIAFLSCPNRSDADCGAVLRDCIAAGARLAVATRGVAGSMALAEGVLHTQAIVTAKVVDTLGAGDGFIAAFLKCRLTGGGIAAALAAGARFASLVCQWRGAVGHGAPWAGEAGVVGSTSGTDGRA
jgi:fructoselysine 6-kinase